MGPKLLPKFSKFTSYLCIIQYALHSSKLSIYATVLCSEFKYKILSLFPKESQSQNEQIFGKNRKINKYCK
jgi:hypothetical protein